MATVEDTATGPPDGPGGVIDLRLVDHDLDFWVDVRLRRVGGSWLAVADLASTPEVAAAARPDLALVLALWPLGEGAASRLATAAMNRIAEAWSSASTVESARVSGPRP